MAVAATVEQFLAELALASPLYFEGGDHESLVRISGADFRTIMGPSRPGMRGEPA